MNNKLEENIKLSIEEEKKLTHYIRDGRNKYITNAKETVELVCMKNSELIKEYLKNQNISQLIMILRQEVYDVFLEQEIRFNEIILKQIGLEFDYPKEILSEIVNNLEKDFSKELNITEFRNRINEEFSTYAGKIYPYIYQLSLSNTQSRRSRAGSTFESIIYTLYELLGYSYDSQAQIGKLAFEKLGLGKVVDSVLPGIQAFNDYRNKTVVGSMKTTLRERWQEVVEEVQRSNLPNIYLLTVDEDIAGAKIKQMAMHNIILVVLKNIKETKFSKDHNVISFEYYFYKNIPEVLNYWDK